MTDYQTILSAATAGLASPDGLASAAAAGACAFEAIRFSAEAHASIDQGLFASWMMTAAEAADGRDALTAAVSCQPDWAAPVTPLDHAEVSDLAWCLRSLMALGVSHADHGDLGAWQRAAACASRIDGLTAGGT